MTQDELKEALHYDPTTGDFTWLVASPRRPAGSKAGSPSHGYVSIGLGGKRYLAHRLAWLYVHGEWPETGVDHKDRDRSNNGINNLREATQAQNLQNRVARGVVFAKREQRWAARIKVGGKVRYVGYYLNEQDALDAYEKAKKEFCPFYESKL